MVIEEGLYAHLIGLAGLSALIDDRVYPIKAPQDAIYPLVIVQRVSGPRIHSHDGASGLAHPRFQISSWAALMAEAKAVATQIRLDLDGYKGTMGDDVTVDACFLATELDRYDPKTERYGTVLDFIIWHHE